MNKRTYILAGKPNSQLENFKLPTPVNLHNELKKMFIHQEEDRQRLRVQVGVPEIL